MFSYLGLLSAAARELAGHGLSRAELVQEGALGLLRALDRHRGREGRSFESFLAQQARLFMLRAIRRRRAARRR